MLKAYYIVNSELFVLFDKLEEQPSEKVHVEDRDDACEPCQEYVPSLQLKDDAQMHTERLCPIEDIKY